MQKSRRERYVVRGDVEYRNSIDAETSGFAPSTKSKPNEVGSIWKGGARERADDVFFAMGIKRRRSKADFAPTCKERLKSIFSRIETAAGELANPPSGRRRLCAVRAFCRRQNLGAGAIHLPRAFEIPKGGAALWAAEPKKKGLPIGSPFFLEHRNSIDAPAFRFLPKTKSQPSVSGCDLERRSKGAGG